MHYLLLKGLLIIGCLTSSAGQFGALAEPASQDQFEGVPRHQVPDWSNRFNSHLEDLNTNSMVPLEGVFLGDSITESWQWEGFDTWEHLFPQGRVVALGLGGDRTENLLWRLKNGYLKALEKNPPRWVALMIGTNNIWKDEPRKTAASILKILEILRIHLPDSKIVVHGILPYGEFPNPWRDKISAINKILAVQLASQKNAIWLDFYGDFLGFDGKMHQNLTTDFLHLTPAGYTVWGDKLAPILNSLTQ